MMDDYVLMSAPSTVDDLRENLARLEQRWKTMRQRPRDRPVSTSPSLQPPSPLLRAYSDTHVDSNEYATPPPQKAAPVTPHRASAPDVTSPPQLFSPTAATKKAKYLDMSSPERTSSRIPSPLIPRHSNAAGRMSPNVEPRRIAALTQENVSRLPRAPLHALDRDQSSICSSSHSRTSRGSKYSVKTDGGAVFSRLYQPNHLQDRDLRMTLHKERQRNMNCPFKPRTNVKHTGIPQPYYPASSKESVGSNGSAASAQTDITQGLSASSRLYDPDYIKKRHAKLEKLKLERELRHCTFVPRTNRITNDRLLTKPSPTTSAASSPRKASGIRKA
ncbi:hypothetical protein SPRG_04528 [Saprolegnia parasitica CBS 223.65]|uniref:Uncharacterized protein n=1 Tax=Saprolegnia parasitica (strain CBS 223.65) TaxID=695850 RepID=A0A067CJE1_SAPPC|nr:hypothetical protein SPRG_04528 [Saprolegnia parasitica CBS 223.65]KDO30628.1 hypothetical protein SPRG_04528 [Saprolegnia parasitica CBS 223.65]|eukprot:XP_012198839.1 hypothetical protein SPRG_04528 [Saprolegnia parasitica CBS 223.65]